MGMRIHQLPSAIANQIAAGEVIERPASVVKELLENALDAGANNITIEIGYGGLNQIKISDNGQGIIAEDLPLAIAAHATSKISTLDDLYAIDTMGFRGEALASIASVAKLSISSRPDSQEHAMMLFVKGAQIEITPCARTVGTTIDVVDLFFNAPVRKRFLKNEKLEFQAIEIIVKRFALSAPHISLTLKHNNKLVFSLPAALNEQAKNIRMTKIFGSAFIKDAIYLEVEGGGLQLSGWVSGPNLQRSQNDRQWVYINQRMVKDKLINHALKQAYDGLLYPGRFPACLLYFTIHTAEVDVNVHPTKHEVRFQQPRLVHDFFTSQLTKALNSGAINSQERIYEPVSQTSFVPSDVREPSSFAQGLRFTEAPYTETINEGYQEPPAIPMQAGSTPFSFLDNNAGLERHLLMNTKKKPATKSQNATYYPESETSWVILNQQYILVFMQQRPYLVNIVALQQKWLSSQLSQANFPLESRPLLVPISFAIPIQLNNKIEGLHQYCGKLGILIELIKEDRLLIRSVPIKVPYLDIRLFLELIAELDSCDDTKLVHVISQSQSFDPQQLNAEERIELNQWLLGIQNETLKQEGLFKALSVEDCRMLLHV
jgi:DNA mismatch repair protein MutL